jgi:glycosyltransferase involved in cell wall biosynthesis
MVQAVGGMRIAYVLTSLGIGGAERQVVALAERMKVRGHEVLLVVLLGRQPEEWPTSVDVARLEMRKTPTSLVAGFSRARGVLREFQPDLIHSHTYPANIAARLLYLLDHLRLRPAPPLISTMHNAGEKSWLRMQAYRFTDFLARHTTTVSHASAAHYLRLKAISAKNSSVLTNGIDIQEFAPDSERRSRMRTEMRVQLEFVWLAAGRIIPVKDYPNLLRAFARVRAVFPDALLWIAGEAENSEAVAMRNLAAELSLEECVRWLGLRRDMPALLDAADGFVLASASEGMPLVVGEAMAMEKPVVATDAGGVRELAGDAGVIVPTNNPEALASAMLETMRRTPSARESLGRAARTRIANHFSIDTKADEWETLYREVLSKKN